MKTKKFTENKIVLLYLLVFSLVATVFISSLVLIYSYENNTVIKKDISQFTKGNINDIAFCIEQENFDSNGDLFVTGWCVLKGVTYNFYNYGNDAHRSEPYNNMNLCYVKDDTLYIVPTKLGIRDDVTEYLDDGINYRYCGIYSRLLARDLPITEGASMGIVIKSPDGVETYYIID